MFWRWLFYFQKIKTPLKWLKLQQSANKIKDTIEISFFFKFWIYEPGYFPNEEDGWNLFKKNKKTLWKWINCNKVPILLKKTIEISIFLNLNLWNWLFSECKFEEQITVAMMAVEWHQWREEKFSFTYSQMRPSWSKFCCCPMRSAQFGYIYLIYWHIACIG